MENITIHKIEFSITCTCDCPTERGVCGKTVRKTRKCTDVLKYLSFRQRYQLLHFCDFCLDKLRKASLLEEGEKT